MPAVSLANGSPESAIFTRPSRPITIVTGSPAGLANAFASASDSQATADAHDALDP